MIPAGYMAKFVADRPDWLGAARVKDVYSVSACVSSWFVDDCHTEWKHNGFWLFDSIDVIREIAAKKSVDLKDTRFFYYEIYERQFDDEGREGPLQAPHHTAAANVTVPGIKTLEGFDAVTFYAGAGPECSPLSCNSMALKLSVNQHCLLPSLEEAIAHLKRGAFKDCEPGPYRIFSVFSV
ncbi:hypothetical protein [Taklimakanibacter albus]|uniref:Uncharacterized protein n=1 Tax=Taklimakanibacter albus TaxID=2800327 RepID=A0ACC5RED4_9HYPH|nr:hypothetical protein [Aestuariivirga sp. YIM B02566]MBK1870978.1 hypothetical protein [Aestuariivirga sp. YIM B02566]